MDLTVVSTPGAPVSFEVASALPPWDWKQQLKVTVGQGKKNHYGKQTVQKNQGNYQWFCFPHNTQLTCTNPVPRPYILSGGIFSPASPCSKASANRLWIEKQEKKGGTSLNISKRNKKKHSSPLQISSPLIFTSKPDGDWIIMPLLQCHNHLRAKDKRITGHTCFVVTIYILELANFKASGTPG